MKTKIERMQELKDAGFSANLTFTTMNKQDYNITLMEVYSFFGVKMQVVDDEVKEITQYKVMEKLFTFRTTEERKNNYYAICEMLNNGLSYEQIGKNLGMTASNVCVAARKFMRKV